MRPAAMSEARASRRRGEVAGRGGELSPRGRLKALAWGEAPRMLMVPRKVPPRSMFSITTSQSRCMQCSRVKSTASSAEGQARRAQVKRGQTSGGAHKPSCAPYAIHSPPAPPAHRGPSPKGSPATAGRPLPAGCALAGVLMPEGANTMTTPSLGIMSLGGGRKRKEG
jgi:hypothetical protein